MVVHDIPLLVETGQDHDFDLVVTVAAEADVRVRRMVDSRGMSENDARARIRAQASDAERIGLASVGNDLVSAIAGAGPRVVYIDDDQRPLAAVLPIDLWKMIAAIPYYRAITESYAGGEPSEAT